MTCFSNVCVENGRTYAGWGAAKLIPLNNIHRRERRQWEHIFAAQLATRRIGNHTRLMDSPDSYVRRPATRVKLADKAITYARCNAEAVLRGNKLRVNALMYTRGVRRRSRLSSRWLFYHLNCSHSSSIRSSIAATWRIPRQ